MGTQKLSHSSLASPAATDLEAGLDAGAGCAADVATVAADFTGLVATGGRTAGF